MSICPLAALPAESNSSRVLAGFVKPQAPYKKIDPEQFIKAFEKSPKQVDFLFDQKMFAHIVGNGLLKDSHLNNSTFYDTLRYAHSELLRALAGEYGVDWDDNERSLMQESASELADAFATFLKWRKLLGDKTLSKEQFLDCMLRHIEALKPGASLLIPGGWQSHGILYEVTKTVQGTIQFQIFNSGSGLIYHPNRLIEKHSGNKQQSLCRLGFNLGDNPLLLRQVMEKVVELQQSQDKAAGKYLYFNLLKWLLTFTSYIEPRENDTAWMYPQRSGICAWRAIIVWQRTKLAFSTHKTLHLCTKIRAFNQLIYQYPQEIESKELQSSHLLYEQIFKPALQKLKTELHRLNIESDQVLQQPPPPALVVQKSIWIKVQESLCNVLKFLFLMMQKLWYRVQNLASHVFAHQQPRVAQI